MTRITDTTANVYVATFDAVAIVAAVNRGERFVECKDSQGNQVFLAIASIWKMEVASK